jgi:hypothetical protein
MRWDGRAVQALHQRNDSTRIWQKLDSILRSQRVNSSGVVHMVLLHSGCTSTTSQCPGNSLDVSSASPRPGPGHQHFKIPQDSNMLPGLRTTVLGGLDTWGQWHWGVAWRVSTL